VKSAGATTGLIYGSAQTYVASNARNVKYPNKTTRPRAVAAGCFHHASVRDVRLTDARYQRRGD